MWEGCSPGLPGEADVVEAQPGSSSGPALPARGGWCFPGWQWQRPLGRGSCPSPRAREEGRERDAVSAGLQVGISLAQNGNSASLVFPLPQGSELSTCLEKVSGADHL